MLVLIPPPPQERPGYFGPYGGRYVPETLIPALEELEAAFWEAMADPGFLAEAGQHAELRRREVGLLRFLEEDGQELRVDVVADARLAPFGLVRGRGHGRRGRQSGAGAG